MYEHLDWHACSPVGLGQVVLQAPWTDHIRRLLIGAGPQEELGWRALDDSRRVDLNNKQRVD